MKTKYLFSVAFFLITCQSLLGQNSEDLIRHTIQNYFNGTAYSYQNQIRSAFYPEAELYLERKDGSTWKLSSEEYIALFKNSKSGSFGGRYSQILSIDLEGSLALVKAEILIPSRNKRYIDVFIMKEVENKQWRIISKAANSSLIEKKE